MAAIATPDAEVAATPAVRAHPRGEMLRRADGLELLGEFEGSGFKEPPLLARRSDGQVVQLTELLYAIAQASDGRRDVRGIAKAVSERCGRNVNAGNVRLLAQKQLRPLGVLALADGTTPELPKREPLMALRHRKPLLPARAVNGLARPFVWLHTTVVMAVVLPAVVLFDVWLFGIHGIAGGLRAAIYNPALLLAVLASVVVATVFHEFGHASACRYGGARPGVMGVGFYLVWPAFYCDVTDAYRLGRAGRLRTDLGGIYFNAIFALIAGGVFFYTGQEAALLAAVVQHVIMLQQLLPLLRFDGYYVLTDLTGVPDILSRIKPIFRSLARGRDREPQVAELKPWVRVVVTAYLVTLIPTLLFLFTWMIMGAPRVLATVHDSFGLQVDRISHAVGPAEAGVGVVRMLMLVMPVAAMSLSLSRVTRMVGRGLIRWSRGSLPRRIVAATAAASLLGAVGYMWWPSGEYEPIRPGERGVIGEAISAISEAPGGRPSFTPGRELTYGAVPTERQAEALWREERRAETPAARALLEVESPERRRRAAGDAEPREGTDRSDQSLGLGEDWMPWVDEPEPGGSDFAYGGDGYPPPDGTAQPGVTTPPPPSTTTEAAPSGPGTTTTDPAPDTTTTPPTTSPTETTPTEPTPGSTDTPPATTETSPTTTETGPIELPPDVTETTPTTTETTPTTTDPTVTEPGMTTDSTTTTSP